MRFYIAVTKAKTKPSSVNRGLLQEALDVSYIIIIMDNIYST